VRGKALDSDTSVTLKENGLRVSLKDGSSGYFNYYWLRDNCPSSFDTETRERVFDIFGETRIPTPARAYIEKNRLEIVWQGQEHVTRFDLDWLTAYSRGAPRPDPAELTRRLWYADHYPRIARFSQPALMADSGLVIRWIEALLTEGVAIITEMPDSDAGLTDTVKLIGHVRPTFFGEYFDVKTHIKPTNLAYTANALELHTDSPAEEMAPGVQFLHCRANSVEGGDSLFLDGAAVAADLRRDHPKGFALLSQTAIPFYCEHDTYDVRSRQRVIELDGQGEVSGVTISQHMADIFDMPQTLLDEYYPAFVRFGQMLQSQKYLMRFRLNAGECIVFDNHRIVHGRASYTAESGDRHLRGCYSDRGEMRSTYRALTTVGRFKGMDAD
jgi:gamma-butyrobetaine dioxygenase